jgi:hypothetical protein
MISFVKIYFFLFLTGLSFPQQIKHYNTFNKELELQKLTARGVKVEDVLRDVHRITNRFGESRAIYLNCKENFIGNNNEVDTTIINVWEIDTTRYSSMFTFWQKVEVANSGWAPLPVEDLNGNGRPELYGFSDIPHTQSYAGPVKIFERNTTGVYQNVFTYDSSTFYVKVIGDLNGNGRKEILLVSKDSGGADVSFYPVFKSEVSWTLPTTFDFSFYLDTLQIDDMVLGDYDNNGITDCAYTTASVWDTTMCAISEYRGSINNFEQLFQFSSIFESDLSGFAIDDFDQDGKTELVISSGPGNIFVIENISENQYSITSQLPFPTYNAYMQTKTNDIDGNGKPEFWIGGQDFENGVTVLQCFEADGDNSYKPVALIELRYLVSLVNSALQAVDIDDDGREELVIEIGNGILILKFVGSADIHIYKLLKDLLIPMRKYTPVVIYAFSYILRNNFPSGITDLGSKENIGGYIKTYPNPFNSQNTITYKINDYSSVKIKIFNVLGEEIKIILNKELSPGEYNIQWDAKDKYGQQLPSGIYFICLQIGNVIKTTKAILLK